MDNVLSSAGWYQEIEKDIYGEDNHDEDDEDEDDEDDDHDHDEHDDEHEEHKHHHHDEDDDEHEHHEHGHHHHHHESGETEEYGIGTFVYYRRAPFDRLKFEDWAQKDYGKQIIRTKGLVYFADQRDMSYIYEQAGKQKVLTENGPWYATLPRYQIEQLLLNDEKFRHDWDSVYGDRMIKLVFIGQKIDKKQITDELDKI